KAGSSPPLGVHVAPTAAGGNTGLDCADAKAISYVNSSANWSATPTGIQIGPGVTVQFCTGTYTGTNGQAIVTTQGNGLSTAPVILLFDAGALFQAGYLGTMPGGCPSCLGGITVANSYIIVDGGSNGTIQNTA